jgi:hypothetical protein
MKVKVWWLLIFFFFYSCTPVSYYLQEEEEKLEISVHRFFKDIPVPKGFHFLPLESFIYKAKNTRIGMLRYHGASWPHTLVEFYRKNMPKYGWEMWGIMEGKESILYFRKDNEICTVKFILKGRKKIILSISISPFYYNKSNLYDNKKEEN